MNLLFIFSQEDKIVCFSSEIDLLDYYTVPKVIGFPRYHMKCNGESEILRGIVHEVSCFPLHFMLYRGKMDYFSDSVYCTLYSTRTCVLDCYDFPVYFSEHLYKN